jgi:hypothetical protein
VRRLFRMGRSCGVIMTIFLSNSLWFVATAKKDYLRDRKSRKKSRIVMRSCEPLRRVSGADDAGSAEIVYPPIYQDPARVSRELFSRPSSAALQHFSVQYCFSSGRKNSQKHSPSYIPRQSSVVPQKVGSVRRAEERNRGILNMFARIAGQ